MNENIKQELIFGLKQAVDTKALRSEHEWIRGGGRIVVVHMFDNRYVAPAAVAFLSMLEHADPRRTYELKVITNDITDENQYRLRELVCQFPNATLEFMAPPDDCAEIFSHFLSKGHYSKEVLYKLMIADLFPQEKYLIVADVDCLYLDDITIPFDEFSQNENAYFAGIGYSELPCRWARAFTEMYGAKFSDDERQALRSGVGGGFLIYNCELMRRENVGEKLLNYLKDNAQRIIQAEQDVLNLVCSGRIYKLPVRTMICTYHYDRLADDEVDSWRTALGHPIQLHYATSVKPWNDPTSTLSDIWWKYVARTSFFYTALCGFRLNHGKESMTAHSLFGTRPFYEIIRKQGELDRMKFGFSMSLERFGLGFFIYKQFVRASRVIKRIQYAWRSK